MRIECRELSKSFGPTQAVDRVNLTFVDGTLNTLIGPSGCGKTTLLKMLNRLEEKTSGQILFNDQPIDRHDVIELRRSIGYVIQETGLFPHFSIYDNIAVVPRLLRWKESRIRERIDELMDLVNLEPDLYLDKYPSQLSGGQRQRVGVARALAAKPQVLLMDEPFGAIDPINREQLQNGFLEIQQQIKKTIVFVTHDIREAIKMGDTISILDQGKVVQHGPAVDVVQNPANAFVEDLLGSDRALKGLELLWVRDYYAKDCYTIGQDQTLPTNEQLRQQLQQKNYPYAFACDKRGRLRGCVSLRDLRANPQRKQVDELIRPIETVLPSNNLLEAVSIIMGSGVLSLPVVDAHERILGELRLTPLLQKISELSDEHVPAEQVAS